MAILNELSGKLGANLTAIAASATPTGVVGGVRKYGLGALDLTGGGAEVCTTTFDLTGDFTVEGWCFWASSPGSNAGIISFGPGATFEIYRRPSSANALVFYTPALGNVITGATAITNAVWHHIALTRSGTTTTLWLDGVSQGATSSLTGTIASSILLMGGWNYPSPGELMGGYIDDVRVTSMCRYTASFTPPAAAFPTSSVGDPNWANVLLLFNCDNVYVPNFRTMPTASLFKVAGSPMPLPVSMKKFPPAPFKPTPSIYFGGRGRVSGTVAIVGSPSSTPAKRRVWLMRERDAQIIAEQWSDLVTGAFSFDFVDPTQTYTVICFDYQHNFRAVVGDNLIPDLIP